MTIRVEDVKDLAFLLADGTTLVIPAIGPIVALTEKLINQAFAMGVIPSAIPPAQAAAMAAALAADRASAVTSALANMKKRNQ